MIYYSLFCPMVLSFGVISILVRVFLKFKEELVITSLGCYDSCRDLFKKL
jgi:hypothetical protein